MSKPVHKTAHKNKPLPRAPNKALPSIPHQTKPRSNTLESTQTYTFLTNLNGSYTTTNGTGNANTNTGTGFTYTTTYYTTSSHAWSKPSKPSKPLQKLQNKTQPPTSTITYYNMPPNNNYTTTYNTNNTATPTRRARANTLDSLQTHQQHSKQPSYHNALPLNPTIVNLDMEYSINDQVDLNDNRQGTIRFIGEIAVELNGAIWYGIQLKKPQGHNNGTLKGISYFKCADNYGTFVEKKQIRWLTSATDIQGTDLEATSRLHINQVVRVKRKKGKGQIRFIGLYNNALKYGIELLDDMGVHSGVVDGKFFFTCGIYRGIFVSRTDILHLEEYEHYDDEKNSLHNRSQHQLFAGFTYDGDSDDSDESVSSVGTTMTVDDDVFDRIQLNERDADMAFTQLLNKFKNVERTQPRPSKLDMAIDASKLLDIIGQDNETLPVDNSISLNFSETSPIEDTEISYTSDHESVGAQLEDEYHITEPPPPKSMPTADKAKKMSIIVGMHTPVGTQLKDRSKPDEILANINETQSQDEEVPPDHKPLIPAMIDTEPEPEPDNNNNITVQQPSAALTSLSPLGLFSPDPTAAYGQFGHSPQVSLNFADFVNISAEDSHLKEIPDSPYDINTTQREFANTANVIQLGSNNPSKLFKILRAMTIKLFQENMKYRVLSSKSNRIRAKLLNYDGVLEFLNQMGFKENEHEDKLECALDQPPLSVLDAAINVCSDFIAKCSRRRAVIDTIKRFNPTHVQILNAVDLAALQIEAENEEKMAQTPFESVAQSGAELKVVTPALSNHSSTAQQEQMAIDKTLDVVYEGDGAAGEELEDPEIESEELADTFKLYEIIASITTHEENKDNSARQIILLCYTTFTDAVQMFNCLDRRFFDAEKLSTYNEKFQWVIQTKVISFIQCWIRQYWDEDWAAPSNVLVDCVGKMLGKIKGKKQRIQTQSRNSKYIQFIGMVEKTMRSQRNSEQTAAKSQVYDMAPLDDKRNNAVIERAFSDKMYDFFKLNNSKIAQQITFLDMTFFGAIKARECLGQAWKKKNKYDVALNICQFIDHFNRIAKWVQARVLLARDVKKRGRTIKKFIKICEQLFILRNFQSLYAVYGALYSSAIIRLKKAWHYVPTKHLAKFEEFKVIFSTKRNMSNLRKLHRETYPPMIPYTGIFLQDLLSIEEGNKKRKDDGAVNFARLLRLSTVIDSILLHQKTTYKIVCDDKLQLLITNELTLNQNLCEDYIWKLSDKIKKIDSKKNNFIKFGAK